MHGYELRKQLNVVLGWSRVLSYGSLYPALKRMLRAGWISEQVTPPTPPRTRKATARAADRPSTSPGTVSRRQRITYELTAAGNDRFATLTSDAGPSAWEDDTFGVRFAFFGRTEAEIRLRILEGRRARLEERLARVRQQLALSERGDRYTAELQRHGVESVEREVRWLSELIAVERNRGQHNLTSPTSTPPEGT